MSKYHVHLSIVPFAAPAADWARLPLDVVPDAIKRMCSIARSIEEDAGGPWMGLTVEGVNEHAAYQAAADLVMDAISTALGVPVTRGAGDGWVVVGSYHIGLDALRVKSTSRVYTKDFTLEVGADTVTLAMCVCLRAEMLKVS